MTKSGRSMTGTSSFRMRSAASRRSRPIGWRPPAATPAPCVPPPREQNICSTGGRSAPGSASTTIGVPGRPGGGYGSPLRRRRRHGLAAARPPDGRRRLHPPASGRGDPVRGPPVQLRRGVARGPARCRASAKPPYRSCQVAATARGSAVIGPDWTGPFHNADLGPAKLYLDCIPHVPPRPTSDTTRPPRIGERRGRARHGRGLCGTSD